MSSLIPLSFSAATSSRRSIRKLTSNIPISHNTITSLTREALLTVPSAFNNQSTRITILFGQHHAKLWSIVGSTLLAKIGQERWEQGTKARIEGFAAAAGTILFWDDEKVVDQLRSSSPEIYKDKIDDWIHQASGMHQYYLWTGLAALGCGVNLQHYNPLIDEEVRKTWGVSEGWVLRAQMVFGGPLEEAGERVQKVPVEERMAVFGEEGGEKAEL